MYQIILDSDTNFGTTIDSITIRAKGQKALGVWPQMELWVGGSKAREWTVSAAYQDYTASGLNYQQGQEVVVVFPNDAYGGPGQDRNLIVNYIEIGDRRIQSEDTSQVILDKGVGGAAFDGLDVIPGQEGIWWNGALRYTWQTPTNYTSSVLTPGTYYWKARARDIFGLASLWSSVWNFTIGESDLISQNLSKSIANPIEGELLTFSGQIKNQGVVSAAASTSRFRLDLGNNGWDPGDLTLGSPSTSSLASGAVENETSDSWTAGIGTHKFELCADVAGVVAESNETNNCVSQVFSVAVANNPPSASNLQVNAPANFCNKPPAYEFSWIYSDPDGDNQSSFDFQVDNNSNFNSPEVDRLNVPFSGPSPGSNNQSVLLPSGIPYSSSSYYWRVQVMDSQGAASGWVSGSQFSTPSHAYPDADFGWDPDPASSGIPIQFINNSICYLTGGGSQFCKNQPPSQFQWDFDNDGATDSTEAEPSHTYPQSEDPTNYTVTLEVKDKDGYGFCSKTEIINLEASPLKLKEIRPQ